MLANSMLVESTLFMCLASATIASLRAIRRKLSVILFVSRAHFATARIALLGSSAYKAIIKADSIAAMAARWSGLSGQLGMASKLDKNTSRHCVRCLASSSFSLPDWSLFSAVFKTSPRSCRFRGRINCSAEKLV
jgi:hypothetical protein